MNGELLSLQRFQNLDPCNQAQEWNWLVVYLPLLKNMKVSWDDYLQYTGKYNMF